MSAVEWLRCARTTQGAMFLDAQAHLVEAVATEPDGHDAMSPFLADPDPVVRLLAVVALQAVADTPAEETVEAGGSTAAEVARYLDETARYFAGTVARVPPPNGVSDQLAAMFGRGLGEQLALRLLKVPADPGWRVRATLDYLAQCPAPAATDALVRFAAGVTQPGLVTAAVRALQATGDRDLGRKVAAERDRLAATGRTMPDDLAALVA